MIFEIVILAMIAAFLGLRLYSALGQRAEHEEESIPHRFDPAAPPAAGDLAPAKQPARAARPTEPLPEVMPAVERGIRSIVAADRRFDILAFLEGAKGAYRIVLEAFWQGDRETLAELCDSDVYESFDAAITAREAVGERLENSLIRVEDAVIERATLDGTMARVTVRFVADIAAVTRDSTGEVVAGSLDDAIETRDVWTFMRDVNSTDPNWLLDETDEG